MSVASLSTARDALPTVILRVNDCDQSVLVDTGCSRCIIHVSHCAQWRTCHTSLMTMDGTKHSCIGMTTVCLQRNGNPPRFVEAIVVSFRPLNFDFVLGMNGIEAFCGVTVGRNGSVKLGLDEAVPKSGDRTVQAAAVATLSSVCHDSKFQADIFIDENDFTVSFDATAKKWTAAWKWTDGKNPEVLNNKVAQYHMRHGTRNEFEKEVADWIRRGWLEIYDEERQGPAKGLIPMMAVIQSNKHKVRPVLDFRELNGHITAYTSNTDVCGDKLRQWRRFGQNAAIIDLKKAYLQIAVSPELWPYQTVKFKGRLYCLTRLGFGLNVAPMIMQSVLEAVLQRDPVVRMGTSSYVDDVFVNESVVSVATVVNHLGKYGLACKPAERLKDGARVLGVRVEKHGDNLHWRRDNDFGAVPNNLTRRRVFSFCGKLVGHFPVCGWLRVATSYIKRRATAVTQGWDDPVQDSDEICRMLHETAARVRDNDPASGRWNVDEGTAAVWTDASSIALGAVLEIDGSVIEDGCWLRLDDASHINMAELDAAIRGVNMALSWKITKFRLITDSRTVYHWMSNALSGRSKLQTKAASEMLIRRRLSTLTALVSEYDLKVTVEFVNSSCNLADKLTRVPAGWLKQRTGNSDTMFGAECNTPGEIAKAVHEACGHPGVRRTLYFARKRNRNVSRRHAQIVVKNCEACQSIDPAPIRWNKGKLSVEKIWQRIAIDVTHVGGEHFLTLIDCGPSRFSIWRKLRLQDGRCIVSQLETIFYERGAPREILADNATVFRSSELQTLIEKWGVKLHFRCAYEPTGNGIAERCHRSIKTIVARMSCSVSEAVYWYNVTPKDSISEGSSPAAQLYRYRPQMRPIVAQSQEKSNSAQQSVKKCGYQVGDMVWVRQRGAGCGSKSKVGTVTGIVSDVNVIVDGVSRHVRSLRPCDRLSSGAELPGVHATEQSGVHENPTEPLIVSPPAVASETNEYEPIAEIATVSEELPSRSSARLLRANPVPRAL